ncbi:hypothetical protein [Microbulbifer spongiae]|uniref:Solute-binding protein family 3/N-terminal domain-containing protein n=1 Tax=Microbulbifer spongiae TaxID=2944933 RepID=A0ABY9EAC5_9GAMM|nr:hypothetical protein [Microbulbifer sp. MI-G]WKD48379.1 hypothetical protein M8T91_10575 [Microbulbifer sp. MI-G]
MSKYILLKLCSLTLLLPMGQIHATPDRIGIGYDQLVDAFDAAWVRIVNSGEYRRIIQNFSEPISEVVDASDYIVNQSDCLPNPDVTPFPNRPRGRFAKILTSGEIRRGYVAGAPWFISAGASTSDWFNNGMLGSNILDDILKEILRIIAEHYETGTIEVVSVEIPFPFNTTSALQDGIFGTNLNAFSEAYEMLEFINQPGVTVDFIDQFNAKGGESENLRRLKGRRATCTIVSAGQFIHIPIGSSFSIESIDDLRAHPDVRICTGNLSTQTANQYFPENTVITKRQFDIKECYEAIRDGDADVFFNSLPINPPPESIGVFNAPRFKPSVDTKIVAGTPYWFKGKAVQCNAVLVPGPFEFGTFRECAKKYGI